MGKKAKKSKVKKSSRAVLNRPRRHDPRLKIVQTASPKTENFRLCPDDLPEITFRGKLIGTASWKHPFRRKCDSDIQMRLYRVERTAVGSPRYLAHVIDDDDVYAAETAAELLHACGEWDCVAADAVRMLLMPRLNLNDDADFAELVAITKRGG